MLVACPECSHEMSDMADACPRCGWVVGKAEAIEAARIRDRAARILAAAAQRDRESAARVKAKVRLAFYGLMIGLIAWAIVYKKFFD